MTRIISIYNAKGGVGKTTTAMNLSAYLAIFGKKTLLVDFDPQANATSGLGVIHKQEETVYHAMLNNQAIGNVIKNTHLTNLALIPSSPELAGALIELVNIENRERILKNLLSKFSQDYDFIIIDLGPSLNLLTINGLLAAEEVIIPIQCEYYSLEGVGQLLETLELIKNNLGHSLKVAGALLTMYDKREKLSREVAEEIRRKFPHNIYSVEIPRSVALAEAPSFRRPIVLYSPQSPGALAYERLAQEVIRQEEENTKEDKEENVDSV